MEARAWRWRRGERGADGRTNPSGPLAYSSPLLCFPFSYPIFHNFSFLPKHSPFNVAMSNPFFSEVPPPLPPKPTGPPRRQHQPTHQPTRSNTRTDPSYAHHPSRSNDAPPRTRPSRSQTAGLPYVISLSPSFPLSLISSPLKQFSHQHLLSSSASAGETFPFYRLDSIG